jgi:cytoskeletal protein RodZ
MKTVGQILQQSRSARKLEVAEVARITRIRSQYLIALEADDYSQLPSATVAKGFIRNYGQFLGLNAIYLSAVFRRDFAENPQGQIVPRGMVEPVSKTTLWSPKSTIIALVTLLFTLFGSYLTYQYIQLLGPPFLEVTSPLMDTVTDQDTIQITGRTDPEATILVNDQSLVLDKGGQFSVRIPLNPGDNLVTVIATSKTGKITSQSRKVTLTLPPAVR